MSGIQILLRALLASTLVTVNVTAAPTTNSQRDPANPNAAESPSRALPSLMDSASQTNSAPSGSSSESDMNGMQGMNGMKDMPGMKSGSTPAQSSSNNMKDMPGMASNSAPASSSSMKDMPGMTNSTPATPSTATMTDMPGMASSPTSASGVPDSTITEADATPNPAPATSNVTNPLYIHVLINHIPEMGLGISLLAVFLGLVFRSRDARRVGLILVFLCAASALPVLKSGQKGYNEIYFSIEPTDRAWLDAHMRTAEEWIWVFYLLAALALVAIVCPLKWPRSELSLVLIVLAFGAGTFALSGYIAYLGGRVRHTEFREGPPPISNHH